MKCQDSRCRDDRATTTRKNDRARASGPANPKSNPAVAIQRTAGNQAVQAVLSARGREDSRGSQDRSTSQPTGPTLEIGDPNSRYEREADRMADRVMRADESESTASTTGEPGPARIQRMCSRCRRRYEQGKPLNCEECEQELQRSEAAETTPPVHGRVTDRIRSVQGGGSQLDEDVRSFFEPRFGQDFSDVRVHTGGRADAAARAVNATAFTLGRDVVFRSGAYRPGTASGRRLLAHELTHVVQQRGNRPRGDGVAAPADGSRVSRAPAASATIQRACANGTWQFECDGCSVPPEHQDKVAHKDNPTGHPETVFGHESTDGLCKEEHDAPCDNHDRCYQTCASIVTHGEWRYNMQHKAACDQAFYEEMQAVCEAAGNPEGQVDILGWNPNCSTYARIYYEAVSRYGDDAFRRRQREACECQEQEPEPSEPDDEGPIELEETRIEVNVHEVERGDTLWDIAEQEYGDGRKWPVIYEENKKGPDNPNGIEDPDLIFPGQVLIIPPPKEAEKFDRSEYSRP